MDVYEAIKTRRSIRRYKPDAIDDGVLRRVLEAARLAPTAANRQPLHFYVVRGTDARASLRAAYGQDWFLNAPVIVCACARPGAGWTRGDGRRYADVDVTIAMDHLILAATAEGLGTCWIGAFKPDELRRALDIPDDLEPIALTPLGIPDESPAPTSRKWYEEIIEER